MLSDILPTGFECGVLNGKVQPGNIVAIMGAGIGRVPRPFTN
jgi:alcohol dehydrogenase